MTTIQADLLKFTASLNEKNSVICDPKTLLWTIRPSWQNLIYEIFKGNEQRLEDIGKSFCSYLDLLEKKPVIFGTDAHVLQTQNSLYASVLKTSLVVKKVLESSRSSSVKKQINLLDQKVAALKYRLESANGGEDAMNVDLHLKNKIVDLAEKWKQDVAIFIEKDVTLKDIEKIERACRFPDFCKLLIADKALRIEFFAWALRDNMNVDQFVQFPATMHRIKTAFLAARVGRLGNELLRIEKRPIRAHKEKEPSIDELKEKVVTLPFDLGKTIKYLNILDETQEVNLHGTWKLKIKNIFDEFSNKNRRVGNVEFFKSVGITVWNAFELGRWNEEEKAYDHIDLKNEDWWRDLPVVEEISKETLEKKYSIQLGDGEWLLCGKAGRISPDLDLDSNHGFIEISIPTENGTYNTYPFGNYASNFPVSTLETLKFIADTQEGKLEYPDENIYYSHRQIASFPYVISKSQGLSVLESIRKDLLNTRIKNCIFQFAGDNCAFWAQSKLNMASRTFPDIYRIKIVKSSPHNPILKLLLGIIRKTPEVMHSSLLGVVYAVFGGKRSYAVIENGEKVYKSLYSAVSRKDATIYHPANLHELILAGKLPGIVTAGHG